MNDKEYFNPESVDEQVDALLQASPSSEKEAHTIHDLQDLHQSDLQSLERVWKRLGLGSDTVPEELPWLNNIAHYTSLPHHERSRSMQEQHSQRHGTNPWQGLTRRIGPIAAVLVAALLVGSLIAALQITRGQHSTVIAPPNRPQVKPPSGLYLSYDKGVTKIDPETGKTVWRYNLAQTKEMPQEGVTKIVPSGNTLFVMINNELKNTIDAGLVALNAQNGSILWQKKLPTVVAGWSNMAVADSNAYVVSMDGTHFKSTIMVLDTSTGATKTTYGFQLAISEIVQDNGRLYLGTNQGLYVVNAPDGTVVWKDQGTGLSQYNTVSLRIVNKIVYASFRGMKYSYLRAYNAQNGNQLWQSKKLDGQIGVLTINGQQLYAITTSFDTAIGTTISAYNINNGHLNWSASMQAQLQAEPEVTNGIVYIPTAAMGPNGINFTLNVLDESTGKRLWQKSIDQDFQFTALFNEVIYNTRSDATSQNKTVVSAYTFSGTQPWKITINEFITSMVVTP